MARNGPSETFTIRAAGQKAPSRNPKSGQIPQKPMDSMTRSGIIYATTEDHLALKSGVHLVDRLEPSPAHSDRALAEVVDPFLCLLDRPGFSSLAFLLLDSRFES